MSQAFRRQIARLTVKRVYHLFVLCFICSIGITARRIVRLHLSTALTRMER